MGSSVDAIAMARYVVDVFGLQADNPLVIDDVVSELRSIPDLDGFRVWLRRNFNHYDTQYLKGLAKFVSLVKAYKRECVLNAPDGTADRIRSFASALSDKVRMVSSVVLDKPELTYSNFREKETGAPLFTKFERAQLDKIGGLYAAARLQRSVSGEDALESRLIENSIAIAERRLSLPSGQKNESGNTKPLEMAKNALKGF